MEFIDTNILLYAFLPGPDEGGKSRIALSILGRSDLVVSVQVLQEFYVQVTHPKRTNPLSHQEAVELIQHWSRFKVVGITVDLMHAAFKIKARFKISYWDAAIIAAAAAGGCSLVLSEDLNSGQSYGQVKVVNPFK